MGMNGPCRVRINWVRNNCGYETTVVMKQLVTNFTYRTANDF